jgi:hypothetical protein
MGKSMNAGLSQTQCLRTCEKSHLGGEEARRLETADAPHLRHAKQGREPWKRDFHTFTRDFHSRASLKTLGPGDQKRRAETSRRGRGMGRSYCLLFRRGDSQGDGGVGMCCLPRPNDDLSLQSRTLRTDVFHLACLVSASAYGVETKETKTP